MKGSGGEDRNVKIKHNALSRGVGSFHEGFSYMHIQWVREVIMLY